MTERDDGTSKSKCVGERREVDDPLGERTTHGGALRVPHIELVHRDDTPGRRPGLRGLHRFRDQVAPEVRPSRIAVDGKDRAQNGYAEAI